MREMQICMKRVIFKKNKRFLVKEASGETNEEGRGLMGAISMH